MRLKYQVVKELCQLMTNACIKVRDIKNILVNLKSLRCSDKEMHLTLKDYQFHFTDYCNTPNTLLLDEVIHKLDELVKSKSKITDKV